MDLSADSWSSRKEPLSDPNWLWHVSKGTVGSVGTEESAYTPMSTAFGHSGGW